MRTWLWREHKDWSIDGLWIIMVEISAAGYVAFNVDGRVEFFQRPFHFSKKLWEEVT